LNLKKCKLKPPRILLIDNYDSFTYNLGHYLTIAGGELRVVRCDDDFLHLLDKNYFEGILISPGPGRPAESGKLLEALTLLKLKTELPVLGICLGMQAMGEILGFNLVQAPVPVHGKTSRIEHLGVGVFKGLDSPLEVMRYHSLILDNIAPSIVEITAYTREDQLPMGLKALQLPWEGIQFHPESIGTPDGFQMIQNWVSTL
jgi:anthranilate synthase/aminodeoxychorismate synthase-like glutamine amidotransferase